MEQVIQNKPGITQINNVGAILQFHLNNFQFSEADSIFNLHFPTRHPDYKIKAEKYEKLKATAIGKFFEYIYGGSIAFDANQLNAIASIRKNTQVIARAGSGKTQVIAGKVAFELKNGLKAKNILTLAFNSKAAEEILGRIQSREKNGFRAREFGNAFTFHGFAYHLVEPKEEFLIDVVKYEHPVTGEEISVNSLQQQIYLRNIFRSCYPKIEAIMQRSFTKELLEFNRFGVFDTDDDYIEKRRKKEKYSYTNDHTRSVGEKYLLDFLYEFGFSKIYYEPVQILPKNNAEYELKKADASCKYKNLKQKIVIEHWGIDEESNETPKHWGMSKDEYLENRNRKKEYYLNEEAKGNCVFIETSIRDMNGPLDPKTNFYLNVRPRIEAKLKKYLGSDFQLKKISKEQFLAGIREKDREIPSFIKRIQAYIQFCQLQDRDVTNARGLIQKIDDEKIRDFHEIGAIIYEAYENKKRRDGHIDFNSLLKTAIDFIESNPAAAKKKIRNQCEMPGYCSIEELSLICIDEYQDFSTLFFKLIKAIEKINPNIRLFVVGDDWQAINQFAGSDIRYFMEFEENYNHIPTVKKELSTNYRSIESIVETGNRLMQGLGTPAIASEQNIGIDIAPEIINDATVPENYSQIEIYLEKALPDTGNIPASLESKRKVALWTIIRAIADMEKLGIQNARTLAISRNNTVYGMTHAEWLRTIKRFQEALNQAGLVKESRKEFKNFLVNGHFNIITAHKSKGKQADSVVILDVSENSFPSKIESLRDDNKYFSVFDDTPENQLENSKRLLYVAITRSKKYLKILTDSKKPSGYLSLLKNAIPTATAPLNPMTQPILTVPTILPPTPLSTPLSPTA